MESAGLKARVVRRLLLAPSVIGPAGVGLAVGAGALASGSAPVLAGFAAAAGLAAAIGMLTNRWLFKTDSITRAEFDRMLAEEKRAEDAELDALEAELVADKDPRTEDALRALRHAYRSLHEHLASDSAARGGLVEVGRQARDLFDSSIASLRRSLDIARAAKAMTTEAGRAGVLAEREKLIGEIQASAEQLRETLDSIRAMGVAGDGEQMGSIRQELDRSLQVAKRVEERLRLFTSTNGVGSDREKDRLR